jgi:hypothetical protein
MAVAVTAFGSLARAEDGVQTRRVELGAGAGIGAPFGAAERGAKLSDTTIALLPIRIDASLAITPRLALVVAASYAPAPPALCQSAHECFSSIGSDVAVSLGARMSLPSLGFAVPRVALGVGYEWMTTKASDNDVTSTRAYDGPLLAVVDAVLPIRIGERWTVGPSLGAALGIFANRSLDAPSLHQSGNVDERAAHVWATVGVRVGVAVW